MEELKKQFSQCKKKCDAYDKQYRDDQIKRREISFHYVDMLFLYSTLRLQKGLLTENVQLCNLQ